MTTGPSESAIADRERLIDEATALLDAVVDFGASLSPEDRQIPRTAEGWCLTDHLSHLAAWIRWANEELEGRSGAPEFGMSAADLQAVFPQFDIINARIHARFAGTAWDDAVVTWRRAFAELASLMRRATPEQLTAPALGAGSLNEVFHDFAIHHVSEHFGWMQEQVAATA